MNAQRVYIAEIKISAVVAAKIQSKHNVTAAEVIDAVLLRSDVRARWTHDDRGSRLVVKGSTSTGRRITVILYPVHQADGVWRLATAIPA